VKHQKALNRTSTNWTRKTSPTSGFAVPVELRRFARNFLLKKCGGFPGIGSVPTQNFLLDIPLSIFDVIEVVEEIVSERNP
jgi:hypothetical protein